MPKAAGTSRSGTLAKSPFRGHVYRLIMGSILLAPSAAWAEPRREEDGAGLLGALLLVIVGLCSYAALLLVLWILAPGPLLATARLIERRRSRCLAVGLATVLLGLGL